MRALATVFITAALLLTAGCASEKAAPLPADPGTPGGTCRGCTAPTPTDTGGTVPDAPTGTGTNPTQTGYDSGATATLEASTSMLAAMFYNSVPNNPTNIRINIDLNRTGEEVIISYMDNGQIHEAALGTVHPYNTSIRGSRYNGWTTNGSSPVWKGFFQDGYGAIVVVVDRYLGIGDGNAQMLGGSVWFQNFPEARYPSTQYAPFQGSEKMCWEIVRGPYDCRTFLVNNAVTMNSSLYPNNIGPNAVQSYRKLGEFNGIARGAAGFP